MSKYRSSMRNPCPICGRTKDGDCAVDTSASLSNQSESGLKVRCHTHIGDAGIKGFIYRGQTDCGTWGLYYSISEDSSDRPKAIRAAGKMEFFYPTVKGDPLAKVVRIDDGKGNKDFAQWHRIHGKGIVWALGLPEQLQKQLHLYRISDDLNRSAIASHEPVLIVEGEGKADLLLSMGIAATSAIGGSLKWRRYGYPNYLEDLAGAAVVLVPDRDNKGMEHMRDIAKDFPDAQWLYPYPDSPLWNRLPTKGGLDIADWIEDFKLSKDRLLAGIGKIPSVIAKQIAITVETTTEPNNPKPTLENVLAQLEAIFDEEDEAIQIWRMGELAQYAKRSVSTLLQIWQAHEDGRMPFSVTELHDLLNRPELERKWLIAAYIPAGTVVGLIAAGGTGKTLLTYDLVKAIATGIAWNSFPTKQTKVLVVQTDEQFTDTVERLEIAEFRELVPKEQVFFIEHWQFSQFRRLRKCVAENNIGFCIIDSFTSTNRRSAAEEKDSAYAKCIYDMRDLASETGCTFVVLHHTNKGGGSRGTTAFEDNVSEVWYLSKPNASDSTFTKNHRILEIKKSRSGCTGQYRVLLDVEDYSWKHEGDIDNLEEESPISARLLSYLQAKAGVYFEPDELIYIPSLSGCKNREAMRKQLERLRKKGLIESEERVKNNGSDRCGKIRFKVYYFKADVQRQKSQSQPTSQSLDTPLDSNTHVQRLEPLPDKDNLSLDTGDRIYEGVTKNSKVIIADLHTLLQIRPNFPLEYQTVVYKVLSLEEENAKCQFNGQIFSLPLQCLQVTTYDPRDPF